MNTTLIPLHKKTVFNKKNLKGQICLTPFNTIEVTTNGDVRLCGCAGWMPAVAGNLLKNSLKEILQNSISVSIRESIIQGTYDYCDETKCGVLNQGLLNTYDNIPPHINELLDNSANFLMPTHIYFAGDSVCNLSCPSCRTKVFKNNLAQQQEHQNIARVLSKNLFSIPSMEKIHFVISTSGEVFASNILLEFVKNLPMDNFPNLNIDLQTNGTLMKKRWHLLGPASQRIKKVTLSIDSASKEIYEKLRRGGKWEILQENLDWLSRKKTEYHLKISMRMVVQYYNYAEMLDFYNMAKSYKADTIEFSRITNWGTFSDSEFTKLDVFNNLHADYNNAMDMLQKLKQKQDVFFQNGL